MRTLPGLPVNTSPTTQQNAPGKRFELIPDIARLTSGFSAETPRSSYVVKQGLPGDPAAALRGARHLSRSRPGSKNRGVAASAVNRQAHILSEQPDRTRSPADRRTRKRS